MLVQQRKTEAMRELVFRPVKRAYYTFLERLDQLGNAVFSFDVDAPLEPFFTPSLFLLGRQDSVMDKCEVQGIVKNSPRATFAVLDRAEHFLTGEQEVLFNALLTDWLDQVEELATTWPQRVAASGLDFDINSFMSITSSMLFFNSASTTLPAYYTQPQSAGPNPGVVIIHELFGLNDHIKSVAQRFAEAGYAALAVDLFGSCNRALCMARFMSGMLFNSFEHQGIRNLKAALSLLAEQPQVDPKRLGAIGFCMGGGLAIAWTCTDERLKAIAPFYGANPRPLKAVARACPVVGSYPETDFTKAQGEKLASVLTNYRIPADIKVYPGARHHFLTTRVEPTMQRPRKMPSAEP